VEKVQMIIARQWQGKHTSAPKDTDAKTEEDAVFSKQSVARL
jgi:hypothetical protein